MRVPLEWLKEFVEIRQKPEGLALALTMSGLEVESIEGLGKDAIFEIGVTPNRADCLSMAGIARDVSAVTKSKFKAPKFKAPKGFGKMSAFVQISVADPKRCPRYSARVIDGVRIGPSPDWMVKRLAAAGLRSINNVVDATNYVMFETGQPLHAFDLDSLRDKKIAVKLAGKTASFTTLDGEERRLVADDLLICDGKGAVALAGVMGGKNSEVKDSTTTLMLESAHFEPAGVRRTSRRLGLSSESSRRFERGVDPNGTLDVLQRLSEIILETAGGRPAADWVDIYPKKIAPKKITVDAAEVTRILGIKVQAAEILNILKRLGISAVVKGSKVIASAPTFRPDIERPIDIIEEVARVKGYGEIPETMPVTKMTPLARPRFAGQEEAVRQALSGAGFSEAALYGFTSEARLERFLSAGRRPLTITNPLSDEHTVMTTSLLPGLLDALGLNASRQRLDCRLFAMQSVFGAHAQDPAKPEPMHIAGVMAGQRFPGAWEGHKEQVDFFDAKGAIDALFAAMGLSMEAEYRHEDVPAYLRPGASARILLGGKQAGHLGALHPDAAKLWELPRDVFVFELSFDEIAEASAGRIPRHGEYSRFPYVERDIAIVVDDSVSADELLKAVAGCSEGLLERVHLFDIYRGDGVAPGKKSVALSLRFANRKRTLTDDEVLLAQERVMKGLKDRLGAVLR